MSDLHDPRVLFAAERTQLAWNRTSVILGLIGITTAIISIYYYLKVVVVLYMCAGANGGQSVEKQGNAALIAGLVVALVIFWFGLQPSSILNIIAGIVKG